MKTGNRKAKSGTRNTFPVVALLTLHMERDTELKSIFKEYEIMENEVKINKNEEVYIITTNSFLVSV